MNPDMKMNAPSGPGQGLTTDAGIPLGEECRVLLEGHDLRSCAFRFLSALSAGLLIDIVIFCTYAVTVMMGYEPGAMGLCYALIEIPVICGILGIFFFTEMIDLAADIRKRLLPFGQ